MSQPLPLPELIYREWDPSHGPQALSEALFAGELVTFSHLPSLTVMCEAARGVIESAFDDIDDPQRAEGEMEAKAFRNAMVRARRLVRESVEVDEAWRAVLAEIGYGEGSLYFDYMRLRIVPSIPEADTRMIRPLPPHRDTWGPNVMAQINWWLPLYPLCETRTMVMWPESFSQPVPNTCDEWDYDVLINERPPNYPLLPEARQYPEAKGRPVVLNQDTLLAFSAAHLHASVRDSSGITRFSLDTRTVWECDIEADRGAPNVDGGDAPPRWEMFDRVRPVGHDERVRSELTL